MLIPGAGGSGWYWHRVVPLLREAGHEAIAVDLPGEDESAGLPEYTAMVLAAIGCHDDVVLAASSLGGFTAPLVAAQTRAVRAIVLVNAMIPVPGETPGAWWDDVGWDKARRMAARQGGYPEEFDLAAYFLHDVPPEVIADGESHQYAEADAVFASTCDFTAWPTAAIQVAAGADDRFFPAGFQRDLARSRLGVTADVLPGGHLMALSQPAALAEYLLTIRR